MTRTELDAHLDAVVQVVEDRDWVSVVEVKNLLAARGLATAGEYRYEVFPNAVIWDGMSEEFVRVMQALQESKRVAVDTQSPLASVLVYSADGVLLNLPIAKRAPKDMERGYAEPRWIPTFFRPRAVLGG